MCTYARMCTYGIMGIRGESEIQGADGGEGVALMGNAVSPILPMRYAVTKE